MHSLRYGMSAVLMTSFCHCGGDSSTPADDEATAPPVPLLSVAECMEAGGAPIGLTGVPGMANSIGEPFDDSSRDDACPAKRLTLGSLESEYDPNGGLCCEVPPLLSPEECTAAGGVLLGDPGGGSAFYQGCEGSRTGVAGPLLGWVLCQGPPDSCFEGAICCRP